MKRIVLLLCAAVLASVALPAMETAAQSPIGGTLRVGVSQCPDGYTGENYAADCNEPATGIEFFLATPNTDNVATGVSSEFEPITFGLEQFDLNPDAPDTVTLGEWATENGDYAAVCTVGGSPLAVTYKQIPYNSGTLFGISFAFDSGDEILCNWYRIDGAGDVDQLPDTGAGPGASRWWG